ncbi:MAG: translocation/assembly module TamB domain-containing protein, partial [Muribaculaceae bacterium]|nr:translocation/assembly module TamB domain-containing protein [Muribaculaceae bacterium]
MKKAAKGIYRILRLVMVTLLVVPVLLFVGTYVALSIPAVQNRIKHEGEKVLSEYLDTQVTIDDITIKPFNQVVLGGVNIPDQQGDSLLNIDKLGAGIDVYRLLADGRVVVTYGEIIGLHGHVTRPDKDSPTNLQFVIDAFKPKDDQPPKPFDVQVRNVVVRQSNLTYDVLSEPHKPAGVFDSNHIAVSHLKADVDLPKLKNNDFDIQIKRLAFNERSGFVLNKLSAQALVTDTALRVSGVNVELPRSNVMIDEVALSYSSLKNLGTEIKTMPLSLDLKNNVVTPADLKAFVPALASWSEPLTITTSLNGNFDEVHIPKLKVSDAQGRMAVNARGYVGRLQSPRDLTFDFQQLKVKASALDVGRVVATVGALTPQARGIITRCGDVNTDVAVSGNTAALRIKGDVSTSLGSVQLDGKMANFKNTGEKQFAGHIATSGLDLGTLLDKSNLGMVALNADASVTLKDKKVNGSIDGHVDRFDFKGQRYDNIDADIVVKGNDYEGHLAVNDELGRIVLDGEAHLAGPATRIQAVADVKNLRPSAWGILKKYPQQTLSLKADVAFVGNSLDNATGNVVLTDIDFKDSEDRGIHLDLLSLDADNTSTPQRIDLTSDYLNGHVTGSYNLQTLVPAIKSMLSKSFPQYFSGYTQRQATDNNLQFDFTLDPDDNLQAFLKLPVKVVHPTTLTGFMDESTGNMAVNVNAPYLLQGNKIIEGTRLEARIDSATHEATLRATTLMPSKNGKISLIVDATGINDRLDANVGWRVMRDQNFYGDLNVSALLKRNENRKLDATIDINPTQVVFNDTAWQVEHGQVRINDGVITVEDVNGHNDNQWIRINGKASRDPDDVLCLELNDMSLDYVFETLNIDNVDFGGRATGSFYASDLFSGAPRLSTPGLHVDDLSYNDAVMGDAEIKSSWLNDEKAVSLYADLAQDNGEHSIIDGAIFVASDSLYLEFDVNKANVSFLKPFMAAFTSDVRGQVSGHATLLGNFHTINLDGDVKADSLTFKLDYTNVYYTCSNELIHIVPDYIAFDHIRIHDREGHEALLGGWLRHNSFHDPSFEFNITKAHHLLCYDTNENINPRWYGTVYGDGAAFVKGEPGQVDIKVNMVTAPQSTFTFVLSNSQEASDYNFITFRDRNKV